MPVAFPSLRVDYSNDTHHLWCNNGTWWLHYTVHFDNRVRRIRRSLCTRSLTDAMAMRDEHLGRIAANGEIVPERRTNHQQATAGLAQPAGRMTLPKWVSRSHCDARRSQR